MLVVADRAPYVAQDPIDTTPETRVSSLLFTIRKTRDVFFYTHVRSTHTAANDYVRQLTSEFLTAA